MLTETKKAPHCRASIIVYQSYAILPFSLDKKSAVANEQNGFTYGLIHKLINQPLRENT